jgi:hypothetical protein
MYLAIDLCTIAGCSKGHFHASLPGYLDRTSSSQLRHANICDVLDTTASMPTVLSDLKGFDCSNCAASSCFFFVHHQSHWSVMHSMMLRLHTTPLSFGLSLHLIGL